MFEITGNANLNQLILLYLVELIAFIYLLNKYNKSAFFVLIILVFFPALFSFISKDFQDIYKVVVLVLTIRLCAKNKVFEFKKGDLIISFFFALFTIYYVYSVLQNNDSWTIILSQFSRYFVVFCLWFIVRKELTVTNERIDSFLKFIFEIFLAQIIITIAKFVFLGGQQLEGLVGSLTHAGGSFGTTIPIVGFIFLWFYRRGKFERKDWLFVAGLMLIGFMAGKRAVWFMMPLVIAAFMIYVPKLKLNNTLFVSLLVAPLAFYLGARLTPNMNPENKVWGSFDYEHIFDFADKYQFGDKNKNNSNVAQGRGGATLLLWDKLLSDEKLSDRDLYGIGLSAFFTTDYEEFTKLKTGINMKGSGTGVFQTYLSTGYFGVFTTLFFYFAMFWRLKIKRIRWVLISILSWEYFMYIGDIFRTPAFMFMIIFFIHYSNLLSQKRPTRVQIPNFPIIKNEKNDIGL